MAGLDDLKEQLEKIQDLINQVKNKNINVDTKPAQESLRQVEKSFNSITDTASKSANSIKDSYSNVVTKALSSIDPVLGRLSGAILEAGRGVVSYGEQFKVAFADTGLDSLVGGFDLLTAATRDLRTSAIGVGNVFGESYEQIRGSYENYIASTILAQERTYQTRQEIEKQTKSLAQMGITMDELTQVFQVAGAQQNFLSEGFLLGEETGLGSYKIFSMMAAAARTMGLSVEDAGKPIVALENIAKQTGLPIDGLANDVFRTAQQFSRLGLTVDGMTPVIRRFTDVLGSGFKGLAIEETTRLIRGLEGQVNKTEAAFLAMQGGLARPGAGVAEAQLAFEDAFKNPIEIVKSLTATLSGVTGGKIIKFEEARDNPQLATQFKIQRDLLGQLTNNTDPQSQRTLMTILADLQSGRQLTTAQNKTLEDSLKSGAQKQEETRTLAERIGKAQVGLLTSIAVSVSGLFDRLLPPQAQSAMINSGKDEAQRKATEMFNKALEMGTTLLNNNLPDSIKKFASNTTEAYQDFMKNQEAAGAQPRILPAINISPITLGGVPASIPDLSRPTAGMAPPPAPSGSNVVSGANANITSGGKGVQEIALTLRGEGEITNALAKAATVVINNNLRGNG